MSYERIRPRKGYELAMEQIKARIESGELAPGSRLASVVELAASLGVGRSTVREALSALQAMGWVSIRQGGGTFVAAELPREAEPAESGDIFFTRARSLKELLEIRQILETGAASLAAAQRSEADLAELRGILDVMRGALGSEAESEAADVRFHLALSRAAGNPLLAELMDSLSVRLHDSMRESRRLWFYAGRAEAERLLEEHEAIYAAVDAANPELAHARMRDHLAKVERQLRRRLHNPGG